MKLRNKLYVSLVRSTFEPLHSSISEELKMEGSLRWANVRNGTSRLLRDTVNRMEVSVDIEIQNRIKTKI